MTRRKIKLGKNWHPTPDDKPCPTCGVIMGQHKRCCKCDILLGPGHYKEEVEEHGKELFCNDCYERYIVDERGKV